MYIYNVYTLFTIYVREFAVISERTIKWTFKITRFIALTSRARFNISCYMFGNIKVILRVTLAKEKWLKSKSKITR